MQFNIRRVLLSVASFSLAFGFFRVALNEPTYAVEMVYLSAASFGGAIGALFGRPVAGAAIGLLVFTLALPFLQVQRA